MRLATFRTTPGGPPVAGEIRGDRAIAFGDGTTVLRRLASGDTTPASGREHALGDVELLAPHRPAAIYGIGRNYAAHAAELGNRPPDSPLVFVMPPTAATGPSGPVVHHAATAKLDYEVELAIVVGRGGAVAGFAVADDVSARDLQESEGQWARAKGADTFVPFGPWVTTVDEVPVAEAEALRLRSWVNGEPRQDASTSDLVFGVDRLVAHIAEAITLCPGDLILTGTPEGVGHAMTPPRYLAAGDVVRMEIERLGAIEHAVVAPRGATG